MSLLDDAFYRSRLITKHLRQELTEQENAALQAWLKADEQNRILFDQLTNESIQKQELAFFENTRVEEGWQRLVADTIQKTPVVPMRTRGRIVVWFTAAAALLLLAGAYMLYRLMLTKPAGPAIAQTNNAKKDISPGGNKAILTLADGSSIVLDSAANGHLASQGNTSLTKQGGQLAYNASGATTTLYNSVSTPRGGQYHLVLADGTNVWLNAESSLHFPTAFNGRDRKIELTGEGYFEVAHNASKPFIVTIPGRAAIQVLGTHFNINSYSDEPTLDATLIQGSVKITSLANTAAIRPQILIPGQQAQITGRGDITLRKDADIDQVMAWKNGLFKLSSAEVPAIMRQIARWYDLEVSYEGKIPEGHISGTVPRSMSLSKVLDALQMSGIKVRVEGKKLIVSS